MVSSENPPVSRCASTIGRTADEIVSNVSGALLGPWSASGGIVVMPSLVLLRLPELSRQRMTSREKRDGYQRTDHASAEEAKPGECAESERREHGGEEREPEFDHEKPEHERHHERRLAAGAVDACHDRDAVDHVEQIVNRR